ncbi:hypothetical protein [Elioraea sp.]|uniref:hypothetical protein n=1 Tax=Elioraea sp. TaxID=2185103 RepID=UPI0021DDCC52|nr:hypothetical protein [Elioraea sp.]GIX09195.1 MAG: hypothetical protein KatS3mg116_0905 [Elioraea sp.]
MPGPALAPLNRRDLVRLAAAAGIAAANLVSFLAGEQFEAAYGGYTSCPLITRPGRAMPVEFDAEGRLTPPFPFIDPLAEPWVPWVMKDRLLGPAARRALAARPAGRGRVGCAGRGRRARGAAGAGARRACGRARAEASARRGLQPAVMHPA